MYGFLLNNEKYSAWTVTNAQNLGKQMQGLLREWGLVSPNGEVTLKELQRTLEKFGLTRIEAEGRPFDPAVHHAMSRVERMDMPEQMVAEEFRAGYRYRDKVLRPSLVAVSVQPQKKEEQDPDSVEIKIKNTIEEEE